MKNKHTAAPWHYNLNVVKTKRKMVVYGENSNLIAVIPSERDDNKEKTLETMKADAALIAAAPELLDALLAWKEFWDDMPKGQMGKLCFDVGLLNDAFIKMSAAINKTKGTE